MPDVLRNTDKTIFKEQIPEAQFRLPLQPWRGTGTCGAECVAWGSPCCWADLPFPGDMGSSNEAVLFLGSTERGEEPYLGDVGRQEDGFCSQRSLPVCGNCLACRIRAGCCEKPHDLNETVVSPYTGQGCIPRAPITPGTGRRQFSNADLGAYKIHKIAIKETAQSLVQVSDVCWLNIPSRILGILVFPNSALIRKHATCLRAWGKLNCWCAICWCQMVGCNYPKTNTWGMNCIYTAAYFSRFVLFPVLSLFTFFSPTHQQWYNSLASALNAFSYEK